MGYIAYIPIGKIHMHLVAVIDWFSRYVAEWRLLDDMAAPSVVACVRDVIEEHEAPRGLRGIIDEYDRKYNNCGLRESLDYETPASWYYSGIAAQLAA